jgi:hypothetical protein
MIQTSAFSTKHPMTHPLINSFLRIALRTVIGLVLTVALALGLYLLFAYHFTYSKGESVGYVQKLSYKGWVCKTWEGEQIRALSVMPAIPEKFDFTVRDAAVADQINARIGQKVVVEYEQHKGLPSCFGETEHFITKVTPAPGE